ncbi:MAG: molybdopterin-guanine dinucleotide biosynthesis protein B [Myxococcales bacterium]|nr:molybdopterin-guanine dinucleotide biosynthesis protein B [Myxococcales bacterium]
MKTTPPPVLCFVGLSNCGKTTLNARVIEVLAKRGFKIGALKHASHGFHMDKPGKDTDRFRSAGAYAIGIASNTERAVVTTTDRPTTLAELVEALPPGLDLVLCEGYANQPAMKIGVHRPNAVLPAGLSGIVAIVGSSDAYSELPKFDADDIEGVSDFVLKACGLEERAERG